MKRVPITSIIILAGIVIVLSYNWREKTLRIYNSYTHVEQVGEMAKTKIFIADKLSTHNIRWVDAQEERAVDAFELVKSGKFDGAITTLYYWGNQDPSFYLISAYPFLYNGFFQFQFWRSERGQILYDQLGKRHNIVIIPCGITGMQICGWWKNPPTTLENLKGTRLRTVGVGAEIFKKLGVLVRNDIPFDRLTWALRTNMLDAVEWAAPTDDLKQQFFTVTPYAMLPGWHEPGTVFQLIINRKTWHTLSKKKQNEIIDACEYSFVRLAATYPSLDGEALQELQRQGTTFIQWNDTFLHAFYTIAQEMLRTYKHDPIFNEMYNFIEENTAAFNEHYTMQVAPLVTFMNSIKQSSTKIKK